MVATTMAYSDSYVSAILAYGGVSLSVIIGLLSLYLIMYFMVSAENAALDIEECYEPVTELMQPIQAVTWYIIQVAVVADFFKISPSELSVQRSIFILLAERLDSEAYVRAERTMMSNSVICTVAVARVVSSSAYMGVQVLHEYQRDADARKWIVRHSFPRNDLSNKFMTKFHSRFIKKGYDMNAIVSRTVLALSKEGRKKKKKS
ncbi:hypothetical protein RB195_015130 [Necator americanus]|uniref:Uncharacterized protein n=1 Tax=Necator americanus TaxID=51031 RepID=A0ABR1E345_NECAM